MSGADTTAPAGASPSCALDHAWIAARVPHQGTMCLLDRVVHWDAVHAVCAADSHRASDNPLRAFGRLGAACGIEYAAQAMAVHGALTAEGACQRQGYLASVRGVRLRVARLDDLTGALSIEVRRFSGDATTMLYDFSVSTEGRLLLDGRAAIFMQSTGSGT